jgi:hypothetical protein
MRMIRMYSVGYLSVQVPRAASTNTQVQIEWGNVNGTFLLQSWEVVKISQSAAAERPRFPHSVAHRRQRSLQ